MDSSFLSINTQFLKAKPTAMGMSSISVIFLIPDLSGATLFDLARLHQLKTPPHNNPILISADTNIKINEGVRKFGMANLPLSQPLTAPWFGGNLAFPRRYIESGIM